jgi:hypothetical protein
MPLKSMAKGPYFHNSKIMPGYKENVPSTFNNFIIKLFGLKLYKETY